MELSVTLFILAVTGTLFYFGLSQRQFSRLEITNFILKKCFITVAVFLMILNTAIIATMASAAGLPVTHEIFTYTILFSWGGYILMMYLMFSTLIKVLGMWKLQKKMKRTG